MVPMFLAEGVVAAANGKQDTSIGLMALGVMGFVQVR
jgi:hypothetical protein